MGANCLRLTAALVLMVGLARSAEATNGLKLTAYGARAAGRGGVDYAIADDGTAPATNPAGMAFVYGNRLDNNWAVIIPNVEWSNSSGSFDNEAGVFVPAPAYSLGAFIDPSKDWEIAPLFDFGKWGLIDDEEQQGATPQPKEAGKQNKAKGPPDQESKSEDPFKPEGDFGEGESPSDSVYGGRVRIGFGVFPVTGGKIKVADVRTPGFAAPVDWETDVLRLAISPSFAFRINDHFSIGLALQIHYGQFELDGGIAQPSFLLRDDFEFASSILSVSNQIVTNSDIDDAKTNFEHNNGSWGFSYKIGAMFTSKYFSAGLVYQDRTYSSDYLGRATVDSTDEINRLTQGNAALLQIIDPLIDPSLGFASVYDVRVQKFEFPRWIGLGFAFRPHERISIGVDYTFIMWSEVMKTFKARLSNGSNPNIDILTSSSLPVRLPLDWKDQHVFAIGFSALLFRGDDIVEGVPSFQFVYRMGYNFGSNPAPDDTALPQQPVIAEHHVSTGFTLHIGPLLEFSFAFEYALPNKIRTNTSKVDTLNLSNSSQEVSIFFMQFGLGVNF